ncbi:efflux RND transporter permease subunit [Acidomonas methanolica]|uniref:Multidrug resistance efflux pump acriflavin resistance protein n=1 Tax=Acidomonas methanolica NBRC 104435 TaxID=1231351 RepID=A0A023D3G6_ACIMT|nr:efflux RND transporter permease subunit [Acidomonas methanolica]MBU2653952.1 efflux RND transporter permease subunit [Acidomonas methanolica]TCS30913.1 multidrug efflux pump [Acidomonas methanolica]GAJ28678.1 multidrug resistance efflux pump acriflavin resistance protein [Acidomonas methanolica NBRC 104435]GBQ48822.1 multidrug efflux pump acriflavin resistance protein AcrB/AcrD/AcrF [Acidomonas methanolica]GEK98290.1 transport system membrane protein [Acidomonas methanolica NBRC 104435]
MNLSRPFILRPVATTLLTLGLVISGLLGYSQLPVADLPNVDMPVIMVQAQQPGGSPSEIASTIAEPLERHLGAIAGLTEMTSQSMVNQVRILLQFDLARDVNGAARDVEAALQAARQDLPAGSLRSNPTYQKANPNGAPILVLALTSKTRTPQAIYDFTTNVVQQQLSEIRGVGGMEIGGGALPAVRVELNPLKLYKFGIGFEDVRAALVSANAHTPKGFIEQNGQRFTLDTNDQATQAQAYRNLVIAYRDNAAVRLSDVSIVRDSVENLRTSGYFNGERAVIALVFAQAGANVVQTIDQIKQRFDLIRAALPPDIELHLAVDRSQTIRAALDDTKLTLIIAVVLVVLVVLLFLRSLPAIMIPAIVVPTSIIGTFGAMRLLGYQLDNMSLMALTISTGFVVDDAIVVLENVSRYLEQGVAPVPAALRGAGEVAFTVISITVSLIAVFIPILLLGGLPGRLFHEFAITITLTLVISMGLSLSLTPMICALLLKPMPSGETRGRVSHAIERGLSAVTRGYAASLEWSLHHQWLMVLSLPATLVLAGALFVEMPKGFFPTEDTGLLMGHLVGDETSSFGQMSQRAQLGTRIMAHDRDIANVVGFVGGRQANTANLFSSLKPKSERNDTVLQTIVRITRHFRGMVGTQFYLMQPGAVRAGARGGNGAYQYSLQGPDADELYAWTPKVVAAFQRLPELMDVSSDLDEGGAALDVRIERPTSARVQITPQLISNILYDAYGQRAASVIYRSNNQYRVIMEAAPRFWHDPHSLYQTWISVSGGTAAGGTASNNIRARLTTTTSSGSSDTTSSASSQAAQSYQNQMANSLAGGSNASSGAAVTTSAETMVPLTIVSRITPGVTSLSVNHQGQSVATTVSFNLRPGVSLGPAIAAINAALVKMHMPTEIRGGFAGNAAQFQKSVSAEPLIILAALITVYVTLGVLYESLVHPLTILSTLPSAGVGAILALQVFREEFSLIAMIGVILLIGIVKKNAIMLIDFALQAQRAGSSAYDAIHEASLLRFRPIIMTSLAAALGAVPLIVANGYGSELRRPLGIAILGGLVVSQALTLYTTPAIFLMLERAREATHRAVRSFRRPHQQDIPST